MRKLIKSYIGSTISVLSVAKKISGMLTFACDDYIVVETAPDLVDIVRIDHIVALEGVKYETFLAAIGRNREAMNSDMLVRAEQLAIVSR